MFERKENKSSFKAIFTVLAISLAVGGLIYYFSSANINKSNTNRQISDNRNLVQAPQVTQLPQPTLTPMNIMQGVEQAIGVPVAQSVAKTATQGVVGITVERVQSGKLFDNNNTEIGVGSGVIVSSNGYILTNNHVAGGKSKRIIVSFADGRNVDGTTVWADPVLDLAVVKVNLSGLPTLTLGDANTLQVGEPAIAIGNPLGLEFQRTVTSGIISALNRTIKIDTDQGPNYMEDLIQTDASINPGNSGGPLLNSKGQVVGINTIKVSSAEAMGFAIPINVAKPIVSRLVSTGKFTEAYMGLFAYDKSVIPIIDGNLNIEKGVYVAHIDDKGPAYKAGLRLGCIISQVDGNDINSMMQLRAYIYSKSPGDTINVTHLMHGTDKWVTVPVKLAAKEKDGLITR
jgi:Trypsin-like serine proteases, typically periplasmic, contain C-terminal PDZ domain